MSARYFPVSITAEAALENFALGTPHQSTSYKAAPDRTASFFGRALYDYKKMCIRDSLVCGLLSL